MNKTEKLSKETISDTEDRMQKLAAPLNDFERATLYMLLYGEGMDLQKANRIRVKAGAVN